jgi:hypothetical protein
VHVKTYPRALGRDRLPTRPPADCTACPSSSGVILCGNAIPACHNRVVKIYHGRSIALAHNSSRRAWLCSSLRTRASEVQHPTLLVGRNAT